MKLKSYSPVLLSGMMLSMVILMTLLTTILIANYCDFFDWLGLQAKKRLLDYPFATFIITPILFWISAYSCRKYSPNASGHRLQSALQILEKSPNDFHKASAFLSIRVVIVKTFSSLIASFGGGALGKEGPSVHMFAALFTVIANKYRKFLPNITLETWALVGSAAGLTVVFNAPIAGVVFVIEKLSKEKFRNFKSNILWSVIVVAIIAIFFHGINSMFVFKQNNYFVMSDFMPLIFTAIICGSIAFVFKKINHHAYSKVSSIKANWWHIIPIVAGLVVALISYYCGIYSFSGGVDTMRKALSGQITLSSPEVVGRILNTIITFAIGCAGGLIAPAMALGTGIGSVIGVISSSAEVGTFLLVGMAAFLAVILGEFITAALIVFEIIGHDLRSIPFLLSAVMVAVLVERVIVMISTRRKEDEVGDIE